MSVSIETDLKDIFNRLDQRFDRFESKLDTLSKDVNEIKISVARLEEKTDGVQKEFKSEIKTLDERLSGKIETLDEKLSGRIDTLEAKVEGIDQRLSNQEFTNRGIFGTLLIIVLGGAAKFLGLFSNP